MGSTLLKSMGLPKESNHSVNRSESANHRSFQVCGATCRPTGTDTLLSEEWDKSTVLILARTLRKRSVPATRE